MEYLLVVAIVLLILLPGIFLFYSQSQRTNADLGVKQLQKIGHDIVDNAEIVYRLGPPSRLVLKESFPDNLANLSIINDPAQKIYELVFVSRLGGLPSESSFPSDVDIRGIFTQEDYSGGLKNVKVEAKRDGTGTYVEISID